MHTAEQDQSLRILVRCYYDYQEEELRLRGILGVKKDNTPKKGRREYDLALAIEVHEKLDEVAKSVKTFEKRIKQAIHKEPLWKHFLKGVKGCGEMMAAVLLTEFDIHMADTVSKMWQFAGLNPGLVRGKKVKKVGGQRTIVTTDAMVRGDRPTEGFLRPYNEWLRSRLCGVLAASFRMSDSPYLAYYQHYKHRLESANWGNDSKHPTDKDRPKAGHQHRAANRYMIKMFLKDLYEAWRTLEELPVRGPYQEQYLGHVHNGALVASG